LRIVTTQELGDLGPGQSAPTVFPWRWHYQAPSLALWLLILGLLVVSKVNRKWQGRLTVIPLALTVVLLMLEGLSPLFGWLVMAWIIVWLAGRWLPGLQPVADGLPTT